MIVTEFARKYGLPKPLVYESSFATDTRMATPWETDIPESELIQVTRAALKKRIVYHREKLDQFDGMLKKLEAQI